MKHIKLSSGSYTVYTSKGTRSFSVMHLNYRKLVKAVEDDDEKSYMELLKPVPTPDGLFTAYLLPTTDELIYSIIKEGDCKFYSLDPTYKGHMPTPDSYLEFVGTYASLEDLLNDNPSYLV